MNIGPFILLHPDDTIVVCRAAAHAGDSVELDGEIVILPTNIEVGHKVAWRALKAGDKVIKYGAPIGSMTADAAKGDHVHMHNMQSDYIKTHTREVTEDGH